MMLGVRLEIGAHDGGVDDVRADQIAAGRHDGFADLDRALTHGLFLDDDAALALEGARHAGPHDQGGVGGVDHRVDLGVRDVPPLDR